MEITHQNFDKVCILVKNGFQIIGENKSGITIEYEYGTADDAKLAIAHGCKICMANNCHPEAETTDPAEIYAKIS